mgnify:CR=1 FL=1
MGRTQQEKGEAEGEGSCVTPNERYDETRGGMQVDFREDEEALQSN